MAGGLSQVFFTDKSGFCSELDNRRISIWRERSMRSNLNFVLDRSQNQGPEWIAWAGLAMFLSMDDKARCQGAHVVEDYLFEQGIEYLEWPTCLPGLNRIKQL
ncbi:hypothetical protein AVEN_259575-1 [Araneus ventricosus]|uniref:Uncharacterized protein n=1 Tax=Araneus ventricosus TaxID=182803 RepID=A0A4Y2ENC1_ARAVE|nr:hypothetical protein AVEN_259575-1 [Araneus ventricosus]